MCDSNRAVRLEVRTSRTQWTLGHESRIVHNILEQLKRVKRFVYTEDISFTWQCHLGNTSTHIRTCSCKVASQLLPCMTAGQCRAQHSVHVRKV
eukprot:2496435-Amphidinium_carterae.1